MRPNAQTLLNDLPAPRAFLCGVARAHSYHLMTSSFSLIFKDIEERTPTRVHDAFCQVVIFHHVGDLQVFYHDVVIALRIRFRRLEMMITTLTGNLQMRLCRILRGFLLPVTAFLTPTQHTLLAPERSPRRAIKARVLYRLPFAIGQEGFESDVNADIRMVARRGEMFGLWLGLTDNKCIPVAIGTQDQVDRLRRSFNRTMQLDLERNR